MTETLRDDMSSSPDATMGLEAYEDVRNASAEPSKYTTDTARAGAGIPVDALLSIHSESFQAPTALKWAGANAGHDFGIGAHDDAVTDAVVDSAKQCRCGSCARAEAEMQAGLRGRRIMS